MWPKKYRDYPVDTPLVQQKVEPGRGICGCEMHDLNGWGNTLHKSAGGGPDRNSADYLRLLKSVNHILK